MRLLISIFLLSYCVSQAQELPFLGKSLNPVNSPTLLQSGAASLKFAAGAETDLYFRPGVNYNISNAPMYVFSSPGDFVLQAKIEPDFKSRFDGGFLVIYQDKDNWAKFGFQKDLDGKKKAVSVITNAFSDQSNSLILKKSSSFFKLEKNGRQLSFYVRTKKKEEWTLLRQLLVPEWTSKTSVGFMAQSPMGQGCEVLFSEVEFNETATDGSSFDELNLEGDHLVIVQDELFLEEVEEIKPKEMLTEEADLDQQSILKELVEVKEPAKEKLNHIVKKGETFFSISQAYDMSLSRLLELNHMSADNILQIGKKLLVEAVFDNNQVHVVERGDTLYSISKKYGIELDNLMKRNGLEGNLIDVGQTLLVAY